MSRSLDPRQPELPLDAVENWARLETHVVDGVFSPPVVEGSRLPVSPRRTRDRSANPTVPSSLFGYLPATQTWRTTLRRLAAYSFCSTLTLLDEETGELIEFRLRKIARAGSDWTSLTYTPKDRPERLVVLNGAVAPAAAGAPAEASIRVVSHGVFWVAENVRGPEARRIVERAGFRFDPGDRWWWTRDPAVAARLDPTLRESLEAQRRELERASSLRVPRNPRFTPAVSPAGRVNLIYAGRRRRTSAR